MDPADLDRLLDRELTALPAPRAPRTLLPRVLAATAQTGSARTAPTGWSTWSPAWQIASIAALLVLLGGAWMLVTTPFDAGGGRIGEATRTAGDAATVVRVLWDVMLQPVATYVFVLGLLLTLACGAAWAAFELALGGASHR